VHVYPLSVFQDALEGVTAAYRDARCGMYGNVYRSDSPWTEIFDQDVGQLSLHSIICSASSPFLFQIFQAAIDVLVPLSLHVNLTFIQCDPSPNARVAYWRTLSASDHEHTIAKAVSLPS
jgi:hypothetical protein